MNAIHQQNVLKIGLTITGKHYNFPIKNWCGDLCQINILISRNMNIRKSTGTTMARMVEIDHTMRLASGGRSVIEQTLPCLCERDAHKWW